jgi:hypothetical protein
LLAAITVVHHRHATQVLLKPVQPFLLKLLDLLRPPSNTAFTMSRAYLPSMWNSLPADATTMSFDVAVISAVPT